jgi:hypothetical protein
MLFSYKDDLLLWRKVGWGDRGYSSNFYIVPNETVLCRKDSSAEESGLKLKFVNKIVVH